MATRDYAKRPASRRPSAAPKARCWLWLVAGIGVGMAAQLVLQNSGGVGDVRSLVSSVLPASRQPPKRHAATSPPKAEVKAGAPKPRFDFYTILPEMEVVVPDSEVEAPKNPGTKTIAKTPDAAPPPTAVAPEPKGTYVLQVGSFRSYAEADQRKAALALLGFEANIQKVTINARDWHRVRIGPFRDLARVNDIRARLKSSQIQAIVLKVSS